MYVGEYAHSSIPMMSLVTEPGLMDEVKEILTKHEGRKLHVYSDTRGFSTIGIGCNLDAAGAMGLVQGCGADFKAVYAGHADLTPEQCDCLFTKQVIQVMEWLVRYLPEISTYSIRRQAALIDLAFNLGEGTFPTFKTFISLVRAKFWNEAGADLLESRAAKQTGHRYNDLAQMLIGG